jgi:D-beta-D-heptose 7-phosphate kinase/D-beta-D-heptose 1-phosphate adenosyltransferase
VQKNLLAFGFAEVCVITNTEKITKERFIDADSGQHLLRTDFGEKDKLKPLMVTSNIEKDISGYDYVVISDYEKGFVTHETAEKIVSACVSSNVPVFVDSKKRDLSCFDGAIIKINEKEYDLLDKTTVNEDNLVVTCGKHGAHWKGRAYPTNIVEVSDVSGAGDTFLASLVYGHHKYQNIEDGIRVANKCSGLVVQKSGTYSLSWQDVQDLCV